MTTLADQPALIAGLAVVSVLFLLAAGVGLFLCHKIHKNKAKVSSKFWFTKYFCSVKL